MKRSPFLPLLTAVLLTLLHASIASAQERNRFRDEVFSTVDIRRDILFGIAQRLDGSPAELRLDLYLPGGDERASRPLIIWLHDGGFTHGVRRDERIDSLCQRFARRGWVCATIDYRLEDTLASVFEAFGAAVHGVQDAKGGVRFFRKMADDPDYRIDTGRIVLAGMSAGSVAAIHAAYLDEGEIGFDLSSLGGLEGSSGSPGYSSGVAAVVNMWGGIVDTTIFDAGEPPLLSIHGTDDDVMPFEYFTEPPSDVTVGSLLYGSAPMTRSAMRTGIHAELYPFPGFGHGLGDNWNVSYDEADEIVASFLYNLFFAPSSVHQQRVLPLHLSLE